MHLLPPCKYDAVPDLMMMSHCDIKLCSSLIILPARGPNDHFLYGSRAHGGVGVGVVKWVIWAQGQKGAQAPKEGPQNFPELLHFSISPGLTACMGC